MKTRRPGKILREGAILLQGFRNPAGVDTTSEPQAGNGPPGAPVNAPMSGSDFAATRVEPWNDFIIPPLFVQGVGFFIPSPERDIRYERSDWRSF